MRNNNEEIDELIKDSLTQEEAKFYDDLEEQNLIGQLGDLFKTKMSWLVVVMHVVNVVMLGLSVYCLVQFFNTSDTNELMKWGGGFFICWSFMAMIKLFIWMQLDKNTLLREMKRLELQIAVLARKS